MLENKIMDQLKLAMKAKDKVALESLRAIKSALLMAKTETGKETVITEEQEITILQRLIKQRKEAAEQFGNDRKELAEKELAQAEIIQSFLPKQFSKEEVTAIIKVIINETAAKDLKDLGKVMAIASKQLLGKAEGKTISEITKLLLS
ncbi:MAG: GatB/YqeY domain-containing protein [Solirubrobacteraceae bacterium]